MPFGGFPWYGQVIAWIIIAIVAVYLFHAIILPLLGKVT